MIPPISSITAILAHQNTDAAPTDNAALKIETKEDLIDHIRMQMAHKFFIEKDDDDPQKIPDRFDM